MNPGIPNENCSCHNLIQMVSSLSIKNIGNRSKTVKLDAKTLENNFEENQNIYLKYMKRNTKFFQKN